METIDISELYSYILEQDILIVGSPKGVGFSTYISEIIAQSIFFNDSYSILVLTHTRKDSIDMLFKIKEAYKYFGTPLERYDNILYTNGEIGSGVCIINYDDINIEEINNDTYDLIIVDKDDFSNYLYDNFGLLKENSKKLIFNTYDLPHSIFYNSDEKKVILTSIYSDNNIQENLGKEPNHINYDRVLLGSFND